MKKIKGFTLVELLVVVVIIGILAAIALPNFIGAQGKAKVAAVKGNMRTIQIAAESYATDAGGVYGTAAQLAPYAPGGANAIGGTAGTFPTNPVTGTTNETPGGSGAIADRTSLATGLTRTSGQCQYVNLTSSYVVEGGDNNGKAVAGLQGYTLVLTNQ